MKITSCRLFQYEVPFQSKFFLKKTNIQARQGLLVELTDENQCCGWGEIAPLPQFSKETLPEAQRQLQSLFPHIKNQEIPDGAESLNGKFDLWLNQYRLYPSVRFGLETAVLNLLCRQNQKTLCQLLGNVIVHRIPVCGLLQGPINDVINQAVDMINEGFTSFKLKIGREGFPGDLETIESLRDILHNQATLCLDANQAWSYEQAIEFAQKIGPEDIKYIEEPFADTKMIPDFFAKTRIPVALDESLVTLSKDQAKSIKGVNAFILKPTILGGIENTFSWIRQAQRHALKTVISSSFETGVGIITLANLAAAAGEIHITAGLDTLRWFKNDILKSPFEVKNGHLDVRENIRSIDELHAQYIKQLS